MCIRDSRNIVLNPSSEDFEIAIINAALKQYTIKLVNNVWSNVRYLARDEKLISEEYLGNWKSYFSQTKAIIQPIKNPPKQSSNCLKSESLPDMFTNIDKKAMMIKLKILCLGINKIKSAKTK